MSIFIRMARHVIKRLTSQQGSLSAFVAVFCVALLAVSGLVVDGGRYLAQQQSALTEAEQAARIGADQLSVTELRMGSVVLNSGRAIASAEEYMAQSGHPGVASVVGDQVIAQVSDYTIPTYVLGVIGVSHFEVGAKSSAQTVTGISSQN